MDHAERPDDRTPPWSTGAVRTTKRRGRTSASQLRALDELGPRWRAASAPDGTLLGTDDHRPPNLRLDVGVGTGEATVAWALEHPGDLVVAVEVHRPALARLLGALDDDGPDNVRVLEADAVEVLAAQPTASLQAVRLLFPDPWPKRRHVGRRMVDRRFAATVADVLVPGGELHVATDHEVLVAHVASVVAAERRLVPVADAGRPPRPVTAYEARAHAAGRAVADLRYRRR